MLLLLPFLVMEEESDLANDVADNVTVAIFHGIEYKEEASPNLTQSSIPLPPSS